MEYDMATLHKGDWVHIITNSNKSYIARVIDADEIGFTFVGVEQPLYGINPIRGFFPWVNVEVLQFMQPVKHLADSGYFDV